MTRGRQYITPMRALKLEAFFRAIAAAMLIGQCLGVVFCGDSNCLQGDSEENCATLVCSLLSKHTVPTRQSTNDQDHSCQCFCHLLIEAPKTPVFVTPLGDTPHYVSDVIHFFSAPARNIDHPPLV